MPPVKRERINLNIVFEFLYFSWLLWVTFDSLRLLKICLKCLNDGFCIWVLNLSALLKPGLFDLVLFSFVFLSYVFYLKLVFN